jgi:vacuolar protein-sorting-associated protein 4
MIHQFRLDIFDRYHARGLEAYRQGDMPTARRSFLKAAETLFKLAAESKGELRKAREAKAEKLLRLARSIPAEQRGAGLPRAAADESGEAAGPDGDQWIVREVPDVSLDDVAGLEDVKQSIHKRVIYPLQHPEVARKYRRRAGGGVLLYGPPGTGKTMIARAIASQIDAVFFAVKCSDIVSKWVGDAERNIRSLFDATHEHPRAVLFLDETEALLPRRGGHSTVMNRLVPEFLAQMDGLSGRQEGLLVLGATNRPWDMDDAVLRPGRFDERIYVPLPDEAARRQILAAALRDVPLAQEVDIDDLARRTEGFSGADCVGLCETIIDGPYTREVKTRQPQRAEQTDVDRALESFRPSVSQKLLKQYETFHNP